MTTTNQTGIGDAGDNQDDAFIENTTFDEIVIGQTASLQRVLNKTDIELFATVSGDINPAHLDEDYAARGMFKEVIAHGMWGGSLISAVLGTLLPGPGTIYLGQDFRFRRPVGVGDTITATVTAKEKRPGRNLVVFDCVCVNQDGKDVITGTAEVIAPKEKIRRRRVVLPQVQVIRHSAYDALLERARPLEPVATAIVHPCDVRTLEGVVAAVEANLIRPILIGPDAAITAAARDGGVEIGAFERHPVAGAAEAAEAAVALAHAGTVDAIVKGTLADEALIRAATDGGSSGGLRTGRRMSHVCVVSVPTYPRLLLITDAALNVHPSLEDKVDICQNAIELAQVLGVARPKVAIVSAVETVSPKIASTIDAAALCKMADRRQITGGQLDGPLAFDNAISAEAARTKGIDSPVAGQADILIVPDIEAGNMVAKQLSYMANAESAGIVLGARVPIVLASLVDTLRSQLTSCAVAALLAHRRRDPTVKVVG